MDKIRIVVILGTRPEAIKLLPVIQAVRDSEWFTPMVVTTGQHGDVVQEILDLAGIEPTIRLSVGRPGITLNQMCAEILLGLDDLARQRRGTAGLAVPPELRRITGQLAYPAVCLVHGDTTSAVAGALAAFHLQVPVTHVEAGLRTHLQLSPFPEELNRQLIARIAVFNLAPTEASKENLIREGIPSSQIFVTGNTGIDAVRWAAGLDTPYGDPVLDGLDEHRRVVVVTAHRRENWGPPLVDIAQAIRELAETHRDVLFVWPLHPNPTVSDAVRPLLQDQPNVHLTEPMAYVPFARLLGRACLAVTDSGGLQEEAPALGTPVLVTREATERTEGLAAGTLKLVGTDPKVIVETATLLLRDESSRRAMAEAPSPYGDGQAARRMVEAFAHIAYDTPAPLPFGAGFLRDRVIAAAGYRMGQLDL